MRDFMGLFMLGLMLLGAGSSSRAEDAPKVATPPQYVHHVEPGTVRNGCAPWGGPAFTIDLPNTDTIVYASLDDIERQGGAVIFEADTSAQKDGMAQIKKCDSQGNNCKLKNGIVSITTIEKDTIIGVVQISMAGWGRNYNGNESHMFRAKYDRTKPICR